MRLARERLLQCQEQSRLADTGLAGDQDRAAKPTARLLPDLEEVLELPLAADERRRERSSQLALIGDDRTVDAVGGDWTTQPFQLGRRELAGVKAIAHHAPRKVADHERLRLGEFLEARGDVDRLAEDRRVRAIGPNDDRSHVHGDTSRERGAARARDVAAELGELRQYLQPGVNGERGVILMRNRPAEPSDQPIAGIGADGPAEVCDHVCRQPLDREHQLTEVLHVHPLRQRRRVDEVAEQHRQLTALTFAGGAPSVLEPQAARGAEARVERNRCRA